MGRSLEGVLIKRAHSKNKYSDQFLHEFACCVADPHYFLSHFFFIQSTVNNMGKTLYAPFDYQKRLIDVYHNYRFSIALMPRQSGKTVTAAGYLLWYAMFNPDSTVLVASHQFSGAYEVMQRVRYGYELCPDYIRAGVISYNKGTIEFDNGSRMLATATTEKTGRGLSINLLYLDEFAFVRPTIAEEFWTSISPTLSTGGSAIITSTPNSDEDQFALIWNGANKCEDEYGNTTELGVNGFKAYTAHWSEHPYRDDEWASVERGKVGEEKFRREFECEFIIFDETLINSLHLAQMQPRDPIRKSGQVRWFKEPTPGMIYTVSLDPSLGTGGDLAAIEVFEVNTTTQIAEWKHNKTVIQDQIRIMADIIQELYEKIDDQLSIYYSVENNTVGEAALVSLAEYGDENIMGILLNEPKRKGTSRIYRKGFNTTNKSKLAACSKFKNLIESNRMTIYSQSLISELKTFIAFRASYAAKVGQTDDLVMSCLLNVQMMQVLKNYHKEVSTQITDYQDNIREPMPFIAIL